MPHNLNQAKLDYISFWTYLQQPGTHTLLDPSPPSGAPPHLGTLAVQATQRLAYHAANMGINMGIWQLSGILTWWGCQCSEEAVLSCRVLQPLRQEHMRKTCLLSAPARVALKKLRKLCDLMLVMISPAMAQLRLVLTAQKLDLRAVWS